MLASTSIWAETRLGCGPRGPGSQSTVARPGRACRESWGLEVPADFVELPAGATHQLASAADIGEVGGFSSESLHAPSRQEVKP
jgi:hypothetical protein